MFYCGWCFGQPVGKHDDICDICAAYQREQGRLHGIAQMQAAQQSESESASELRQGEEPEGWLPW